MSRVPKSLRHALPETPGEDDGFCLKIEDPSAPD